MFAYCFNNPVNLEDDTGNWPNLFKVAVKWVAKNIVKPAANYIEKQAKKCNLAFSKSQSLNVQASNVSIGYSIGISVHMNGDVLIQSETSTSLSTSSSFGVSSQTSQGVDFIPNFNLHSDSTNVALNATAPIPNTPISGDGSLVYKQNYSKDGKTMYPSFAINAGAAFPSSSNIELGLSAGISSSNNIYKFNIYDFLDEAYIKIMEW